jgi:UDP-sulfoquinovose synthase
VKRRLEMEEGVEPLEHVLPLHRRVGLWRDTTGKSIELRVGDLTNARFIDRILSEFQPAAVVHYAEQPSAPYSMQGREAAVFTQYNNVIGTLNLLFAMKARAPSAHLIKLGTMGEYGTPNIDIEEGYIKIEHNGRSDTLPFPKMPGSFYHLSKVHDSHNIHMACRIWELRATDLNQGVVYGIDTDDTLLHPDLRTSFHYDDYFGTVLNRFVAQAVSGVPLTVYGKGGQTRGYLNIRDTIKCVELAGENPPPLGEMRVMNQFTEQFTVLDLATRVGAAGRRAGLDVSIKHIENPRIEAEEHYYNAKHSKLVDLGLRPIKLTEAFLDRMLATVLRSKHRIDTKLILPRARWRK